MSGVSSGGDRGVPLVGAGDALWVPCGGPGVGAGGGPEHPATTTQHASRRAIRRTPTVRSGDVNRFRSAPDRRVATAPPSCRVGVSAVAVPPTVTEFLGMQTASKRPDAAPIW